MKLCCPHPREELTPPDAHGYAICSRCAGTVTVFLTKYQLDRAMRAILRREQR